MPRTKSIPKRLEKAAKKQPMLIRPAGTAPDSAPLTRPRQGPLASIRQVHRPAVAGGIRRPARYKPGERALLEIRKYQRGCDLLITRVSYGRLVHDICRQVATNGEDLAWEAAAMEALHYVAETHITCVLSSKSNRSLTLPTY